jgi:hypothetical protein
LEQRKSITIVFSKRSQNDHSLIKGLRNFKFSGYACCALGAKIFFSWRFQILAKFDSYFKSGKAFWIFPFALVSGALKHLIRLKWPDFVNKTTLIAV